MAESERTRLENAGMVLAAAEAATTGARRYDVTLIESGTNANGWVLPAEVLAQAATRFDGAPCLLDHPGFFEFPSLRNLAGTYEAPVFVDVGERAAVRATLRLADTPAGELFAQIFDAWLSEKEAGEAVPPIGLSAYLSVRWGERDDEGRRVCKEITDVWSVDAVLHPAAGGAVERVLNSALSGAQSEVRSPMSSVHGLGEGEGEGLRYGVGDARQENGGRDMPEEVRQGEATEVATTGGEVEEAPRAAPTSPLDAITRRLDDVSSMVEQLARVVLTEEEESTIEGMGREAMLPGSVLTGGQDGLEQIRLAAEAMILGTRPPGWVRPLTGIRELYNLLSGDYEMTGVFREDRVYLANVTSATMAGICANALNKAVVNQFAQYPQWWRPIVVVQNFSTLQDVKWITLGGVGELPTVAEGAAYTELTWDDMTETESFVKKGGYLGITLEAIDKDDTGKMQAAPRALAQAAWLTLSKAVSAIFTANSGVGPTLDTDSTALFHTDHSNLGTSALTWSSWVATRTAMRKQTDLNSSERLGALTAPRFLLVPPDLEITALQVLASEGEPGTADNDVNPEARGDTFEARMRIARERVIVVDLWTDADNWAAVADPALYPSIGLGFRYGETPEIFSVASPTAGLMFSNDTMPVKVRFFYAVGPTDYRGLYKHNVS